ncbi:serine/threonine-protein kinase [Streptomyces sp. TLI_171]|uniref:serine/threonine-protein kinase n=1 Tax=Streptomyces sp. TLI_171 TaxID=1938859 RepID=UPI000C5A7C7D|nr:serine/threonine-protein kinase [Streptomyces sp. TLI_171]RKE20854.1 serine/threonine protein kinase [Streptomyces sp. TLI_171]
MSRTVGERYLLAEKIGHGGMGQVWAAHDRRLDRRVAVKLLRADAVPYPSGHGDGQADLLRQRFLRECRISAALDHPGLVTVYDAGVDDEELYLVMQRVPGLSLADLIAEEGPLPVEQAAAVAGQLCAALGAVHGARVVHRDLKPSNVMIRPDGRAVLLDLGIAAALDPTATRLTLTGSPIGSPAYMAPEQAMAADADRRSDLYALGCMLHEMLAGQPPFPAPTALGVLRRQVDDPPVPLRRLRAEVPAAVEALVLRLLAKHPAERPADAAEVHAMLLPLLPAPTGRVRTRLPAVPDPGDPYRYPHHPQPAADPVELPPAAAARAPAPRPEQETLSGACARLSDLVEAGRHTEVLDLAAALLPRAVAEQGEAAPLVRTVRAIRARTLLTERRWAEALPELRRLTATAAPHDPAALDHRRHAARCLEHLGHPAEALAEYRAVLAALPPEAPAGAELRERIGLLLAATGHTATGWQALLELLLETERRHGPHHPDVHRLRTHLERLGAHRTTTNPYAT